MANTVNSADLTTYQGLANTKTAAATDRHHGQSRYETDLAANNQAQVAWERNLREDANMEIGRARNITRVV
ncbi:MAG: hypothetical protein LBP55_02430 [Candidatus Adiutrix sp.]|jgi:hypothetical protein|nr:hypothetical protein [Candidatus Adiutrix sp.]